jgi:two-component system sensor histidine kinase KdpD
VNIRGSDISVELPEGALSQSHVAHPRGRLKIFLGMAAGVGKTYTMLSEAHRRASRGEDVVVGYIEPHARPETAALIDGLDAVPPKRIVYRDHEFLELDTRAVIGRRPAWVLIDELAHTNAPGTEHVKRWQSIEQLLDLGINVISTVNIQHLESLNDAVFEITGIRVRETFPDHILDEADEVVVVDLTPVALINRLRRGAVYDLAKVDQALVGFFTPDKLSALRELALRQTADEVDEQLRATVTGESGAWAGREVIVVCVTARSDAVRLVRRGFRLAERLHGDLHIVHVAAAGGHLAENEREVLNYIWEAGRNLGGHAYELAGDDIATEIVDFAVAHRATFIVLGQSVRSRVEEVLRGSIVTRIMRETRGIDVVIVSDREEGDVPRRAEMPHSGRSRSHPGAGGRRAP